MADYASNCPISGPRNLEWKITADLGGLGFSYDWGMFYPISGDEDVTPMRKPDMPRRNP